ncbi:MAG: esterase/lipase family protein [Rubripirellula sp.]
MLTAKRPAVDSMRDTLSFTRGSNASASSCREAVVLIHGMLANANSMRTMGDALNDSGYQVNYWSYPSIKPQSIRVHGQNLASSIRDLVANQSIQRLHFVTHSMGCIVLRVALQLATLPASTRIVMLAPPNSGSRLTRIPMGPIAHWFPQLPELSESANSLVNQLEDPAVFEIGVMAAQHDRVVDLERTHLKTQSDHLVVSTSHQRLPGCVESVRQVIHFLVHGRFQRAAQKATRHAA